MIDNPLLYLFCALLILLFDLDYGFVPVVLILSELIIENFSCDLNYNAPTSTGQWEGFSVFFLLL